MTAGVPVVAANRGALPEVLGDAGAARRAGRRRRAGRARWSSVLTTAAAAPSALRCARAAARAPVRLDVVRARAARRLRAGRARRARGVDGAPLTIARRRPRAGRPAHRRRAAICGAARVVVARPGRARRHVTLLAPQPLDAVGRSLGDGGARIDAAVVAGPARGTRWEQTTLPRASRRRRRRAVLPRLHGAAASARAVRRRDPRRVVLRASRVVRLARRLRRRLDAESAARARARVVTISEFSQRRNRATPRRARRAGRGDVARAVASRVAPPTAGLKPAPRVRGAGADRAVRRLAVQSPADSAARPRLRRRSPAPCPARGSCSSARTARSPRGSGRDRARARHRRRVDVARYVTDAELAQLYREARSFAFLSDYEGFGLTPLEAHGRGRAGRRLRHARWRARSTATPRGSCPQATPTRSPRALAVRADGSAGARAPARRPRRQVLGALSRGTRTARTTLDVLRRCAGTMAQSGRDETHRADDRHRQLQRARRPRRCLPSLQRRAAAHCRTRSSSSTTRRATAAPSAARRLRPASG